MSEVSLQAYCFVNIWVQTVLLNWERTGDMGSGKEREKEGVESGREVGRKVMKVSGPEEKGKEI